MKKLNHFSHQHPLWMYEIDEYSRPGWDKSACHLCGGTFDFRIYGGNFKFRIFGCKECRFFIHDICAKLPEQLDHPFHPEHTLALFDVAANSASGMFQCHACGVLHSKFIYHCAECNFSLDFLCQELTPNRIYEGQPQTDKTTTQNGHPHPLFVCSKPDAFSYRCSFCELPILNKEMFVCIDCKNLLHEYCALPLEIRHPFHSEHPLVLFPAGLDGKKYKCNACSSVHSVKIFHCSQCEFSLDTMCASLFPTQRDSESYQEIQSNHLHPLIQCDNTKNISYCSCCNSRIEGSVFVCLKCGILLDKLCIELLPEINHPFHPQHPLTLTDNIDGRRFLCRGCKSSPPAPFFAYACCICDFYLDPRCSLAKPLMIQSKVHQHPIAFLKTKLCGYLSCRACGNFCNQNHVFQCPECEFGLHLKCFPLLPQVVKHNCHCDPLTLTYSRIEEIPNADSDEEFYCYACEEARDPDDPTYYCKECPFVAHIDCVLSEIMHYFARDYSDAAKKVDKPGLSRSENNLTDNTNDPQDSGKTNSTDVPTEETKDKVAREKEKMVKESVIMPDENINREVAAMDEEIAALQTRIEELKERKKKFLASKMVSSAEN